MQTEGGPRGKKETRGPHPVVRAHWESPDPRFTPKKGGSILIICPVVGGRKGYEEMLRSELRVPQRCPDCRGRLHRHGFYVRGVDALHGPTLWLRILRLRCTGCRKTHALLPSFVTPYQRMSTPAREAIARRWALGRAHV